MTIKSEMITTIIERHGESLLDDVGVDGGVAKEMAAEIMALYTPSDLITERIEAIGKDLARLYGLALHHGLEYEAESLRQAALLVAQAHAITELTLSLIHEKMNEALENLDKLISENDD